MKSKIAFLAIIAMMVAIVVVMPSTAATIVGSAHDFSGSAWSGNEICAPCHIPHNASSEAALWARGSLPLSSQYTLWGDEDVLSKRSLTCLSCHDGTVALGITGETMEDLYPGANLGQDLTNDHPIGVAYNTSSSRWVTPTPGRSASSMNLGDLRIYLDDAGEEYRVECSSCHSVHGTDYPAMLRTTNYASGVCLSCHIR
jgi:predicted CXXCH cytochrome family protein